ncbi:hypothetical protein TIFTF001_010382 [Ficus carica]|uniref:Uncharacterized protein n=1 Tax=Ficus carica TaxID=3494 RepID=A0AA88A8L0_FICCA|nr:hypothetical protein TIFTF001_010382 [Ficus carica]
MGLRALPLTTPRTNFLPNLGITQMKSDHVVANNKSSKKFRVLAKKEEESQKKKQSLFSSVTEALDFSQVRSAEDAQLLEEARQTTGSGERMTRQQWMGNMWKKGGWTRHAKCARRTQGVRKGKSTSLADMCMWPVWKSQNQATFSPDSSLAETGISTCVSSRQTRYN